MRHAIQAVVVGVLSVAALCLGYGGFEVTGTFNDAKGLNHTLDSLNQVWKGSGNFNYKSSMWWFGGHGGARVGVVTIGGSGAVTVRANHTDSLGSEMAADRGNFEVGDPYSPVDWFWVRSCLEIGGAGCAIYAHSVENGVLLGNFSGNFKRWYSTWVLTAAPGVEVMGTLPGSYVSLFTKASYVIPIARSQWLGDKSPPAFSLGGFSLQIGLRFGETVNRANDTSPSDY